MDRADTFTGRPFPEKWAGNRFSVPLLLIIMEKIPFIRVYGNDTLLTIGVPYPEFAGTDLLLYADDLAHGAAAVTAALANECHKIHPFSAGGFSEGINIVLILLCPYVRQVYPNHSARYSISPVR
jgi:hypothetical protein